MSRLERVCNQLLRTGKPKLLFLFLRFPASLYAFLLLLRNKAFDWGWKKTETVPCKVVSVGNISLGGTGKTPLMLKILEDLKEAYSTIAVLSRGYRSQAEKALEPVEVNIHDQPKAVGDEALLIKQRYPDIRVYSFPKRVQSARVAISKGARVLLLDDAFQHRYLNRDVDICVLDARNPFGGGYCLPAGLLREPLRGIQRADLIVLMHAKENTIRQLNKPVVGMYYDVVVDENLEGPIALFSGIAQPSSFEESLCHFNILGHLVAEDHHAWTSHEIESFAKKMKDKGAKALICTEKDLVKVDFSKQISLPILAARVELKISFGHEHWVPFLANLQK